MNNQEATNTHDTEEFKLRSLYNSLQRHWPVVLAATTLGGLASIFSNSVADKLWEGNFEIVISDDNASNSIGNILGANPMLANLAGLSKGSRNKNELETTVKILNSPSTLKPVFNNLTNSNSSIAKQLNKYTFDYWARNIELDLEQGTSVLTVKYRDKNKDLILPVLGLISESYKDYSTKDRSESINEAIRFSEDQLLIYRKRAEASYRALNSFSAKYGISSKPGGTQGVFDIASLVNPSGSKGGLLQIPQSGTSSSLNKSRTDAVDQLAAINQELIRLRQTFTDKDPTIILLESERDALKGYIESTAFGVISYPGRKPLSKVQAQDIALRHSELERQSDQDQSTLSSMERALLSLRLEKARSSTPWKVISTPVLIDQPVAPRKLRNIAMGIFSGMIIGCGGALFLDKKSGKIYSQEEFSEILPSNLLLTLLSNEEDTWESSLEVLGHSPIMGRSVGIVPLGEISIDQSRRIQDVLKQSCNMNVEVCRSIIEASRFEKQLLLASPGSATKVKLQRMAQEISLNPRGIIGWIWIDSKSINT